MIANQLEPKATYAIAIDAKQLESKAMHASAIDPIELILISIAARFEPGKGGTNGSDPSYP